MGSDMLREGPTTSALRVVKLANALPNDAVKRLGVGLMMAAATVLSGCATRAMKGTPFYTGEYSIREGPAEDRVNLWPALYYRKPALSVLWPLAELTEDHFAVRPLMSVYGLDDEARVYNVLWPIARIDKQTGANRVFPVFWDEDSCSVFPLYRHEGDPFGARGGSSTMIPLWCHRSDSGGYNTHVLWPFIHLKDRDGVRGARVWPLAGSYRKRDGAYRFFAWPLGHQWSAGSGREFGCALLPLFFHARDEERTTFFSLPYSWGEARDGSCWALVPPLFYRSADADCSKLLTPLYSRGTSKSGEEGWSLLLPLYYSRHSRERDLFATLVGGVRKTPAELSWMVLPLLAGGRNGQGQGDLWFGGPLAHVGWDRDSRSHHVFPLYYRSVGKDGSVLFSLPWSSGRAADGSAWQLIPPLFYHAEDRASSKTITPLYSRGEDRNAGMQWDTFFPLYYRSQSESETVFATLFGGSRTDAEGRKWLIYPLLSGGSRGAGGGEVWLLSPFFHAQWSPKATTHHLLPFYYWNGREKTLISPLTTRWRSGQRDVTLVPPLLSMVSSGEKRGDLWSLGGLAHFSWGDEAGARHLLPVFYADGRAGTFVSPLGAKWKGCEGQKTFLFPPAVSWLTRSEDRNDLWVIGPLAHFSWGDKADTQHVFPLYYRDRRTDTFISPLLAKWRSGGGERIVIPPLLSGYARDGDERSILALLGVLHQRWGGDPGRREGHLVPLYYYEGRDFLITPLFGWNKDEDAGFVYPLTPLVGIRTGNVTGSWLFPFYSRSHDKRSGRRSGIFLWGHYWAREGRGGSRLFPFYSYRNQGPLDSEPEAGSCRATYGKSFNSLLICRYRDQVWVRPAPKRQGKMSSGDLGVVRTRVKEHSLFPVWSCSRRSREDDTQLDVKRALLLALYDYKREVRPSEEGEHVSDYTRSRVLWRLWHYEKLNGDVSVDVFPGITYDSRKDGFRKVSFLWRMFRYEAGPVGKKLDLLFVPLVRKRSA